MIIMMMMSSSYATQQMLQVDVLIHCAMRCACRQRVSRFRNPLTGHRPPPTRSPSIVSLGRTPTEPPSIHSGCDGTMGGEVRLAGQSLTLALHRTFASYSLNNPFPFPSSLSPLRRSRISCLAGSSLAECWWWAEVSRVNSLTSRSRREETM